MGGSLEWSLRSFTKLKGNALQYPFWKWLKNYRQEYIFGLIALVFVDLINVILPLVIRMAVDAMPAKEINRVWLAGGLYFSLMAVQAVGRYLWRVYLIGTSHKIAMRLRLRLYQHLQKLPLQYYQTVRTGDLMSRATNDIESIRMAVGPGILVAVDAFVMFLLIVPLMFWLSPKLSFLAFAFYPLVPWLTVRLGNRIDKLYENLQEKMSEMGAFIQESFQAVRLIKSLVLESKVYQRFLGLSESYRIEGVQQAKFQAGFSPLLSFITNLGTFLILLLGGFDVMEGVISVGTFIAFQRFVVQLSWPMEAIGWAVTMNREGFAANRRLEEILSCPEVHSSLVARNGRDANAPILEVKKLNYHYPQQEGHFQLQLHDLVIAPGKKVGLVGPVGSGKTTFFNLLLRLYEPTPGSVYFDGEDVAAIPLKELRQKVASVEQQIFLFSETIEKNITLGQQGEHLSEAASRAAKTAEVVQEIGELEKGFQTTLGERGVNLSGGQKQRIALARALAREPRLLLLDDCFSAVDVAVEKKIIERFFEMNQQMAVCFASHRLSIMPRMDEIWLLDDGKIVDKGTHEELLGRNSLYQSLWEKSERAELAEHLDLLPIEGEVMVSKLSPTEGEAKVSKLSPTEGEAVASEEAP